MLNPGEQEAARAKCLEGIAALLRQCSIREALYRNSYDGNTEKKGGKFTSTHKLPGRTEDSIRQDSHVSGYLPLPSLAPHWRENCA